IVALQGRWFAPRMPCKRTRASSGLILFVAEEYMIIGLPAQGDRQRLPRASAAPPWLQRTLANRRKTRHHLSASNIQESCPCRHSRDPLSRSSSPLFLFLRRRLLSTPRCRTKPSAKPISSASATMAHSRASLTNIPSTSRRQNPVLIFALSHFSPRSLSSFTIRTRSSETTARNKPHWITAAIRKPSKSPSKSFLPTPTAPSSPPPPLLALAHRRRTNSGPTISGRIFKYRFSKGMRSAHQPISPASQTSFALATARIAI